MWNGWSTADIGWKCWVEAVGGSPSAKDLLFGSTLTQHRTRKVVATALIMLKQQHPRWTDSVRYSVVWIFGVFVFCHRKAWNMDFSCGYLLGHLRNRLYQNWQSSDLCESSRSKEEPTIVVILSFRFVRARWTLNGWRPFLHSSAQTTGTGRIRGHRLLRWMHSS